MAIQQQREAAERLQREEEAARRANSNALTVSDWSLSSGGCNRGAVTVSGRAVFAVHPRGDDVLVTGNTVIDALLMTAAKDLDLGIELDPKKRLVLITSHRRENFGENLSKGIKAIVGKGQTFEAVNLVGTNMILLPRKSQQK